MKYITAKCPFCNKEFKAPITWSSFLHRQVAQDHVRRDYEGHVPICFSNPNFMKSAPIPTPEYIEKELEAS